MDTDGLPSYYTKSNLIILPKVYYYKTPLAIKDDIKNDDYLFVKG